ncbi:tlde1 domain-containing protein [Pseudescherichia vulneris]|uniref:tlde1 domain-containing protein n=1 Tax=Pseudescherichia vulneris TaxID=566 RepID=UPI003CC90B45
MFISCVRRSHFRIHPLRPDGSGTSWGCITFFRSSDFIFFGIVYLEYGSLGLIILTCCHMGQ